MPRTHASKPPSPLRSTAPRRVKLPLTGMAMTFRHLKPSWREYITIVERSAKGGDKKMGKLYSTWVDLPLREKNSIMPEQLCDLAGVSESELYGAVCAQAWTDSRNESALITALAQPRVVDRTVKEALKPKGFRDREMFHKSTGFLPTPKGGGIHVNVPIMNSPSTPLGSRPSMNDYVSANEEEDLPLLEGEVADVFTTPEGDEDDDDGDEGEDDEDVTCYIGSNDPLNGE